MLTRVNGLFIALAAVLAFSLPASAEGFPGLDEPSATPESRPDGQEKKRPFRDFLNEDETRMLFDFMRDVFIANLREEEPEGLPPELAFKLEILKKRMNREGNAAVRNMLFMLQKEIDRAIRDMPSPEGKARPDVKGPPGVRAPQPPMSPTPPSKPQLPPQSSPYFSPHSAPPAPATPLPISPTPGTRT